MKLAIFDVDGVIADTLTAYYEFYSAHYKEQNLNKLSKRQFSNLSNLNIIEVCNEVGLPLYKLPFFMKKIREIMLAGTGKVRAFPGIAQVISTVKGEVAIVSDNYESVIKIFLGKNKIRFSFVQGHEHGNDKAKKVIACLAHFRCKPSDAYYAGDSPRDIKAGKKAKVVTIACCWGFHSRQELAAENPDFLASRPKDLLKILPH